MNETSSPSNHPSSQHASRRALLSRCQRLSRRLRPNLPPEGSSANEFAWQCRALAERVQTYEALLSGGEEAAVLAAPQLEYRLQRLETALNVSLEYFRRVFLDLPAEADEELPPHPRRDSVSADERGLR